jgi:LysR family hydrogen peroxide-inducible transcriptional activator
MLTIKNLKYLVQLAKDLHFHKAANNSFVAQSSLSAGIKSLEDYLGIQLFVRDNKKVLLTPIGKEVVAKAQNILNSLQAIDNLTKESFWDKTINIGVIPTISPYILPNFITNVAQTHPQLKFNIIETTSANLVDKLTKLELDFAIFAMPYLLPSQIKSQILFSDKLYHTKHKNYNANKILLLDEGHCLREHILSQAKISPSQIIGFNCSSINTLIAMIDMQIASSFIPEMALELELKNYPNLVYQDKNYKRDIGIIYHQDYAFGSELLELTKLIKSSTQELAPTAR